jgi:hypothetical protein
MERNNNGPGQKILAAEVMQLKAENSQLKEEIQNNKNEIEKLKEELEMTKMQLEHKDCNKNCVLCAIGWICGKYLGLRDLCGRQLEKIITAYASHQIENEDLKCDRLMEMLEKCGIVTKAKEFKYEPASDNAWKTLVEMDGGGLRVVILGRIISEANSAGHVEVCELDKRKDGKVTINDPQIEKSVEASQQDFRNHVINDEGLILYAVQWDKLIEIIKQHWRILHHLRISGAIEGCQ